MPSADFCTAVGAPCASPVLHHHQAGQGAPGWLHTTERLQLCGHTYRIPHTLSQYWYVANSWRSIMHFFRQASEMEPVLPVVLRYQNQSFWPVWRHI